jgi:DNA polymerase III alpha subunit
MKLKNKNLKRGDSRDDGKLFWGYDKNHKDGERWITLDQFQKYQDYNLKFRKKYYSDNRNKGIENANNWIKNNRDQFNKRRRENRIKNIEIVRQKESQYKERSKHLKTANHAKRRSLKKQSSVLLTKSQKQIIDCFYAQAHRLENRIGIKFHVDHIVPLSKGGLHSPANLQTIPARINISKNCHRIFTWREL